MDGRRPDAPHGRAVIRRRLIASSLALVTMVISCAAPPPPTSPSTNPGRSNNAAPSTTIPTPTSYPPQGTPSTCASAPPSSVPHPLSASRAASEAIVAAVDAQAEHQTVNDSDSAPVVVTSLDKSGKPSSVQVVGDNVYDIAANAVEAIGDVLDGDGQVLSVEPDIPANNAAVNLTGTVFAQSAGSTDDMFRFDQWALDRLAFESVAAEPGIDGGNGVVVAVVDSGVAGSHPDLVGAVSGSANFTDEPSGWAGEHATHVAGIIAARAGNGIGIVGAAPRASILNAKALRSNGLGYDSWVANALRWATDAGADVVNISASAPCATTAMQQALSYAESRGVIVVAAGGNAGDDDNAWSWPAAATWPVAVAAFDRSMKVSYFSTRASYIDVSAPGEEIFSTLPDLGDGYGYGYGYMSGTSMAAPYVSALAALMIAASPSEPAATIRARLVETATDMGAAGWDSSYGWGRVNPIAAVGD